jgi:hypothetical protein
MLFFDIRERDEYFDILFLRLFLIELRLNERFELKFKELLKKFFLFDVNFFRKTSNLSVEKRRELLKFEIDSTL